jgi:hypothetical protein
MNNFLKKSFRVTGRLLWLVGEILLALLDFVINVMFARKTPLPRARSLWLQQTCRRVLRVMKIKIKTQGPIPLKGLLVSNHLGYLDIPVLSAVALPCSSRKRRETLAVLGCSAIPAGTLFVRRAKRSDVTRLNRGSRSRSTPARWWCCSRKAPARTAARCCPSDRPCWNRSRAAPSALRRLHPLFPPDGDAGEDVCWET